jgi:hypothetical protein
MAAKEVKFGVDARDRMLRGNAATIRPMSTRPGLRAGR